MSIWKAILNNLPEVEGPSQKFLSFKEKLKWTFVILMIYYFLGLLPLFGLGVNALQRFETLSIILGAEFGSLISLGIGPIVTASIVLQLLNGSGILKLDLTRPEGKKTFQGLQKLLAIFFIIFEAAIYVLMGGLAPATEFAGTALYSQLQLVLIFQLFLGGVMILFMDEVVSKWGFGSGIGLFIVAGVSKSIFIQAFNWLPGPSGLAGITYSAGAVPALFQSLTAGDPTTAAIMFATLVSTALVFAIAVYAQAMKIEIPLSFGMVRGHGVRWPLSFFYTSVIPVILVSALIANFQLLGRFLQNAGIPFLGRFSELSGQPISGFVYWLQGPNLLRSVIEQHTIFIGFAPYLQSLVYLSFLMLGAMIFSIFWMQTAGMDARSQAKQMMSSGLQIPGFRRDERVLERLLNRYIWPLTIMGGLAIGFLAGIADITGTLSSGTGILLAVMIVYKLYEEVSKQHMMDMNPMMRKFMGG
ncbi:MAG: preprotein translocase subunit SecY [Candidatus Woesearchaeota archaeon]|jgi:preprotein translocase subunit SecY|nr:preprotein translocase subunit SecY [Candidatus Woesearchaeota archaeon]MDP7623008.1 preprotein translocase subunit SecY [Candidatus Woesearchaeota archaeon]HJN56638.1 preprotein translocase subunit SecY [Candidatus Woesearchaeota archaeon]|tara:strand:- start:6748 stop:8163 length:1416 start_codon:yes stop_codon:yes gene_type:complete